MTFLFRPAVWGMGLFAAGAASLVTRGQPTGAGLVDALIPLFPWASIALMLLGLGIFGIGAYMAKES